MRKELYLGLMSGTSMDGVDAALVDFGESLPRLLAFHLEPIPQTLRDEMLTLCQEPVCSLDQIGKLDVEVAYLFAQAASSLLTKAGISPEEVIAIGSHGQTLRHRPTQQPPYTWQIGDPNIIAEQTGLTTVADFRRRDIAAGGEGAPLVPAFHAAYLRSSEETRAVVNIGGIANLTLLPKEADNPVIGFDSGPGNALLDSWIQQHLGVSQDQQGVWAKGGTIHDGLLDQCLSDPYFAMPPPKSTGREYFHIPWLRKQLETYATPLDPQSVQATMTALTAITIAQAVNPYHPARVLITGGGVHNDYLMSLLAQHLTPAQVQPVDDYGIHADWMEAMAFAWLAKETLAHRPGNLPGVTGSRHPCLLGGIYLGKY